MTGRQTDLVMPTYPRPTQKADMTRFMYTVKHVPAVHWIVVEDFPHKTPLVARMLETCGLPYTHLNVASVKNETTRRKRGVLQRNAGLKWLRDNTSPDDGVLYFADDDNTYDLRIFELMRSTHKVSVWAVGLVGGSIYENVNISDSHHVVGWHVNWYGGRKFAIDMAGFAINLRLVHENPSANFYFRFEKGYLESMFLDGLGIQMKDLEPVAENQTEVLVWHTQTKNFTGDFIPPGRVLEV